MTTPSTPLRLSPPEGMLIGGASDRLLVAVNSTRELPWRFGWGRRSAAARGKWTAALSTRYCSPRATSAEVPCFGDKRRVGLRQHPARSLSFERLGLGETERLAVEPGLHGTQGGVTDGAVIAQLDHHLTFALQHGELEFDGLALILA
jgi:hypothetical protein